MVRTLGEEEPEVTSVALRPGTVDTQVHICCTCFVAFSTMLIPDADANANPRAGRDSNE